MWPWAVYLYCWPYFRFYLFGYLEISPLKERLIISALFSFKCKKNACKLNK